VKSATGMRRGALACALTLGLCAAAGMQQASAQVRTTPSAPGAGYRLDWEDPADQTVPAQAPPGWRNSYDPGVRHSDGEPQVRVAAAANGEPVRAGSHSVRFDLVNTDPAIDNSSRAEIKAVPVEPAGAERWYGVSTYLPTNWLADPTPEVILQWHQTGGDCSAGCSPPLSIFIRAGHYWIQQSWQNDVAVPGDWTFGPPVDIGAYQTGQWTDWVVHVKWSLGSDGVLEIWKDGQPVPGFDPKPGRNDDFGERAQGHGNYLILGIYKWPWSKRDPRSTTTRRILYTDELRITDASGNYDAVAPSSGSSATGLTVSGPLQITPGASGAATLAGFAVTNLGPGPVSIPYFLVGVRTSIGSNIDFPASTPVTLQPGKSFTYQASRTLAAGSYTAWPAYFDGQDWHELGPRIGFAEPSQ
jgi:hypothetical protein